MENTAIILHVESGTVNSDVVQAADTVQSETKSVRSAEITTDSKDAVMQSNQASIEDNRSTASETSNENVASSVDQTLGNGTPATVSVKVNRGSSQKPDTILFMVVNTLNSKCVSVFVPFAESRDLQMPRELSAITVYAYGLRRQTNRALEWYTVLSHSYLSLESNTSFQEVTGVPKRDVPVVQMPALRFTDIQKSLPFSAKNSMPAKIIQEKWNDAVYTFTGLPNTSGMTFIQQVLDGSLLILVNSGTSVTIPLKLRPARDYQVYRMEITQRSGNVFNSHLPTEMFIFRTKMSCWDVRELYGKAVGHLNGSGQIFEPLRFLYRNKSPEYFNNIFSNQKGWMNAYIKNNGGDPASVLNGRINGLFFSAVLQEGTGQPPPCSPFGSARLFIPTFLVFNDDMNLYFADFYCHSKRHKVTLVLTPNGSEEDKFCQRRLELLDPYNNEFLYRENHPPWMGPVPPLVTVRVIVEIFLTMDLNIEILKYQYPNYVFIEQTEATTSGTSMVEGLPKCPTCTVCNLSRFCY